MFKQIKKLLIALVLVFALFLVACEECPTCPEPEECPTCEDCTGKIDPEQCPETPCPEVNAGELCPDNGYIKPEECPEAPAGLIAPTEVTFYSEDVEVGKGVKFEVELTPADAVATLLWASSDPSIATVDAEGNITGVRPGKVTITATSALNSEVFYEEEVEVVEKGKLDFEIAEREKNAIVAALSAGYVSGDFDLPTTWNQSAVVTYMDPNGAEIEKFVMPDLGEATSQNYAISGNVTYGDAVAEFNVTLKLVAAAEGKNDYEKVDFAVEVAEAFLYEYMNGEKVTENIYLPESVYGVTLGWSTNKAYVLTAAGELTRPNNDAVVTFTITPKCGAASKSHTLSVTAAGYTTEEKLTYVQKTGVLKGIAGAKLYANVALPEEDDKFGIKLTYSSSDEGVITSEGLINTGLIEDTKVTLTVTAVYNDLNAAETAFVEVFDIEVTVAAGDLDVLALQDFAAAYPQLPHIPYGAGEETTIVLSKAEYDRYVAAGFSFEVSEDFKVTEKGIELVTQYFRYHESKINVKHGKGAYVWTINTGIGAEHDIVYLGGRSQSNQASKNPAERGDMLQGFSKWDKYVGVVSSNSERTTQQYWSEFSGYTMYVDAPTGSKKVTFTKDHEGNVKVVATNEDDYVRYQMFHMQFATIEITGATAVYADKGNDVLGYIPRTSTKHLRSTYGGNFGTFYVNMLNQKFDIPVSALSMGGTFADGVAMKTYTKSSISLAVEKGKAAVELKDDYGNALKVTREQNWSLDGYRPAFAVKPATSKLLEEGDTDVKYTFTLGTEDATNNASGNNNTVYVQYAIKSTESKVWGTPYIELAPYGMAFGFHSQILYSLSNIGGYYLAGADKDLPMYVSRYFRHAENEEISDYIRDQIKSYFTTLVTIAEDKTTKDYDSEDVVFADISIADLEKLDALKAEYDALYASWKQKADVAEAGRQLAEMIEAAQNELIKQAAYAELTQKSFADLRDVLEGLKEATLEETRTKIASAEVQALIAAAKRNYESLTDGQKGLYDKGYGVEGSPLYFEAKKTAGILEAIELQLKINALSEVVTSATTTGVKDAAKALEELANKNLYAVEVEVAPSTSTSTGAPATELVVANAASLINDAAKAKLAALQVAVVLYEVEAKTAKIDEAEAKYTALNAAGKAIVDKTFANVKFVAEEGAAPVTGVAAHILIKEAEVEKIAEAEKAANIEKTVKLAKEIKDTMATLPTAAQFEKGEFTSDQYTAMNNLVKYNATASKDGKINQLVSLYKTLGINTIEIGEDVVAVTPTSTSAQKIALLVAGVKKQVEVEGDNPETKDVVEQKYMKTVQDEDFGNFAGEGEKEALEKLYACPAAYDKYVANSVIEQVELLPGAKILTLEDEAAVKAARAAYKAAAAVPAQLVLIQAYISSNPTYVADKIAAAEAQIAQLKLDAKSMPVEVLINAIPAEAVLTLEDKAAVTAAQNAYNALNGDQKANVSEDSEIKLSKAVAKIAKLEEELILASETYLAAEKAYKEVTKFSTTNVVITSETKADAEALVAVYEAMIATEAKYFAKKYADAQDLYEMLTSALAVYNQYAA